MAYRNKSLRLQGIDEKNCFDEPMIVAGLARAMDFAACVWGQEKPATMAMWHSFVRRFSRSYRSVLFDYPNQGAGRIIKGSRHSSSHSVASYTPSVKRAMKFGLLCVAMQRARTQWIPMIVVAGFTVLSGCATYQPAPAAPPSAFDRAWNAAQGAAQDEGVRVTSADRSAGVIIGFREQQEVTINLQTQADGTVRIEMSARGPKGSDPGLAGRISRAYDRRMGR